MRLFELFVNEDDPRLDPGSRKLAKLQKVGSNIGDGGYAMVRKGQAAKREGEVIKIPHQAMLNDFSDDPYVVFVKIIQALEKRGYKNPYFPKIIKFKSVKDNNMNFYYAVLEHLHPMSSVDPETIEHLKSYMFHNYQTLGKIKNPSIDALITDAYEKNPGNIKDKQFAQALKIIHSAQKRSVGFGLDIAGKEDNIMFRKVGGIPQLVLSDPIA